MSISITSADVEEIIEVDSTISLTPFMNAAIALVTECCSTDDYDDTRLNMISIWLSAHFYAIRDSRTVYEGVGGGVNEKYQSKVDLGFDVTHYGQMAMRLDTAGGLAKLNQQMKKGGALTAGITWVGLPLSEIKDVINELG